METTIKNNQNTTNNISTHIKLLFAETTHSYGNLTEKQKHYNSNIEVKMHAPTGRDYTLPLYTIHYDFHYKKWILKRTKTFGMDDYIKHNTLISAVKNANELFLEENLTMDDVVIKTTSQKTYHKKITHITYEKVVEETSYEDILENPIKLLFAENTDYNYSKNSTTQKHFISNIHFTKISKISGERLEIPLFTISYEKEFKRWKLTQNFENADPMLKHYINLETAVKKANEFFNPEKLNMENIIIKSSSRITYHKKLADFIEDTTIEETFFQ